MSDHSTPRTMDVVHTAA